MKNPLHFAARSREREEATPQAIPSEAAVPQETDTAADGESAPDAQVGTQAEEALLVEQARQDPAAFGILYERYVDRIYAYIFHRVGNTQDAEDLTARTFYRALDRLDSYEDRGLPFSAWLFRIAHNLVANWHRDRKRRHFLSLDRLWFHGHSQESPEERVEEEERLAALSAAIERLPEERKNLLFYKFGSRLSNLEIGELMNKSESAIKSLYFRTLAALRKDLEARGWGMNADGHSSEAEDDQEQLS
ncbi:sigma-70 family RNA polymerase sigma factor [Litorilinea aerophila]|uniref:RNA polymerase sigma factor n=1 Tax=Litorilinea aerophila TaxID=1204385 RepID=UPI001476E27E|nr:sigma-70 family RNA polymerase sigma factor [Litorilinea aerophila]MCC9077753.1 sigma-70 family RNA polymerase sigma factor [Litorilinea aerophila]